MNSTTPRSHIDVHLIEKALALGGKTMEDMEEWISLPDKWIEQGDYEFSIEKFYAYLLSPSFIEKYMPILFPFEIISDYEGYLLHTAKDFGETIYNYQSGDSSKLINLLSKQ